MYAYTCRKCGVEVEEFYGRPPENGAHIDDHLCLECRFVANIRDDEARAALEKFFRKRREDQQ